MSKRTKLERPLRRVFELRRLADGTWATRLSCGHTLPRAIVESYARCCVCARGSVGDIE